jgi:hypothetical protein
MTCTRAPEDRYCGLPKSAAKTVRKIQPQEYIYPKTIARRIRNSPKKSRIQWISLIVVLIC